MKEFIKKKATQWVAFFFINLSFEIFINSIEILTWKMIIGFDSDKFINDLEFFLKTKTS
jgi:hypothetical protein